jgi:hypothetical protein
MATTLQQEMRRLVQEQPQLSCAGLLQQLQDLGWRLELPVTTPELLESTPAWVALLSIAQGGKRQQDTAMPPQLLPSGHWGHVPDLLAAPLCTALEAFCDQHFVRPGLPPVELMHLKDPLRQQTLQAVEAAARQTIRQFAPPGHPLANEPFVLLMNRCLLRRTYPPQRWSEALRNNNNQHWHQDSNRLFGGRAMLTLWIPLQDGAGSQCPGLETSSVPASFFSATCGDSTPEHGQVCTEHGALSAQVTLLEIARGHGAAFNGLTYHRTGLRHGMGSHRDALLLRLCTARDAARFPGDRSNDRPIP